MLKNLPFTWNCFAVMNVLLTNDVFLAKIGLHKNVSSSASFDDIYTVYSAKDTYFSSKIRKVYFGQHLVNTC